MYVVLLQDICEIYLLFMWGGRRVDLRALTRSHNVGNRR